MTDYREIPRLKSRESVKGELIIWSPSCLNTRFLSEFTFIQLLNTLCDISLKYSLFFLHRKLILCFLG